MYRQPRKEFTSWKEIGQKQKKQKGTKSPNIINKRKHANNYLFGTSKEVVSLVINLEYDETKPKNRHCRFYCPHCHTTKNCLSPTLCYSTINNIFPTSQVLVVFLQPTFKKQKTSINYLLSLKIHLKNIKNPKLVLTSSSHMKGAGSPSTEVSPKNLAPKQWLVYNKRLHCFWDLGLGSYCTANGLHFKVGPVLGP